MTAPGMPLKLDAKHGEPPAGTELTTFNCELRLRRTSTKIVTQRFNSGTLHRTFDIAVNKELKVSQSQFDEPIVDTFHSVAFAKCSAAGYQPEAWALANPKPPQDTKPPRKLHLWYMPLRHSARIPCGGRLRPCVLAAHIHIVQVAHVRQLAQPSAVPVHPRLERALNLRPQFARLLWMPRERGLHTHKSTHDLLCTASDAPLLDRVSKTRGLQAGRSGWQGAHRHACYRRETSTKTPPAHATRRCRCRLGRCCRRCHRTQAPQKCTRHRRWRPLRTPSQAPPHRSHRPH